MRDGTERPGRARRGVDGRDDARTRASVLRALAADPAVRASDVDVDVDAGRVALRGLVDVAPQRERAEQIAAGVPGVVEVDNQLHVRLHVSADDVAERVTGALAAAAIAGLDRIIVTVSGNDVTLDGTVTSRANHDAALAAAASSPGVAGVHDALTVRPR
jgi:osmotically-inducible protein OsmY